MATSFLKRWLFLVLLLSTSVVGVNLAVDPYGLFGTPRVAGFNALKPAAANRSAVIKPYQVAGAKVDVLIVGNSRPEMGLAPDHPCLAGIGSGYSLTLPGAGVYQMTRYAQHAMAAHTPRRLLVGVDFLDFLVPADARQDPARWPPGTFPFEGRLAVDAFGRPKGSAMARFSDYRDALYSLTAFTDSLRTIAAQSDALATTRRPDGFNPAQDYLAIIRAEGQSVLFAQKRAELDERLSRHRWALDAAGHRGSVDFTALQRLLDDARTRGIPVTLFINPYHDTYMDVLNARGLGALFDAWKVRLQQMASERDGVALWDFARSTIYTGEPAPRPGDRRTVLNWFWEPAHYRRALGDLMLAQMSGVDGCAWPDAALPKPGVLLVAPRSTDQEPKLPRQP